MSRIPPVLPQIDYNVGFVFVEKFLGNSTREYYSSIIGK
jgi:hypothetical protein